LVQSNSNPEEASFSQLLAGVGIAVAHALIQAEARVILTSSRQAKLDSVLKRLRDQYPASKKKIDGYVCDLGSEDIEQNIINLFKQTERPDHIIYLAGDRLPTMPISDFTPEAFAKQSQVRAVGPLLIAKHGLALLEHSPNSSITITSGSIAEKPIAGGWSLLAFIGAGLTGLTRQLAFDLAPIRVNCVAPGVVETDMWDGMGVGKEDFFKAVRAANCLGRVGQAEDVAEAYLYLLKDKHATGTVVHSSGGVFLK
jgi:NAD(P)-dependent dehydrogenase (short-subunit alcohol dehydrogenase family)